MATCLVTAVIITEPPFRLQWRPNNLSIRFISSSRLYARWDSNAETVRTRRFGFDFKRGGQNDDEYDDEEDDEEGEGFFKSKRKKRRWWSDDFDDGGIMEDAFDYFWIFKVFKSYGWFFPVILVSWLLSSGPKAFLMAMALPLGQSLLWMAFDKLWGGTKRKSKPQSRTRTRWPKTATDTRKRTSFDEEEEEEEEEIAEPRRGKRGYQSWAVDGGREKETGFGGWDDLEREKSGPVKRNSGPDEVSEGKLSRRRRRKSETPLFMRLLIAVFPFLGSWTKILW